MAVAIIDVTKIDLNNIEIPKSEILEFNPQRDEFEQIDNEQRLNW